MTGGTRGRWVIAASMVVPAWALVMAGCGRLRWDYLVAAVLFPAMAWWKRTRDFLAAFIGFVGVGLAYDAMRFVRGHGPAVVHTCDLRAWETSLFGIRIDGVRAPVQDWFFVHHSPLSDAFFAVPYGIYIFVAVGYAIRLYTEDPRACRRYSLGFLALNLLGFATYKLFPAAPPWYVHEHGCAVIAGASSFEGRALARVDLMLGAPYFHGLYGRAAEVFGAIPSLHVAYPVLILFEEWKRHGTRGRVAAFAYLAWMSMAAVYLDHHWLIDIVLGWTYAVAVGFAMRKAIAPAHVVAPQVRLERETEAGPAVARTTGW